MPKGPSLRRKNSRINRRACRPQSCLSGRGARSGKWEYILEKIAFCPDGGEAVEFYVLEQTRLAGRDYILVTESLDEEEGEALILRMFPLRRIRKRFMKPWTMSRSWTLLLRFCGYAGGRGPGEVMRRTG